MRHSRISTTVVIYTVVTTAGPRDDGGDGRSPHVQADCSSEYSRYFQYLPSVALDSGHSTVQQSTNGFRASKITTGSLAKRLAKAF